MSEEHQESPRKRAQRHEAHQEMLEEHKKRKALARERHRNGWHRFKILATTLR
jgi:hypothetical protein